MSIYKDVIVNIQRLTSVTPAENSGLTLILSTESTTPYKEYTSLALLSQDFVDTTSAYKMGKAIFSQIPPVDKVAVVGIERESELFDSVITGLNATIQKNPGFTFLVSDVTLEAEIVQLASWGTTNKIFYLATIPVNSVSTIQNPNSDYVIFMVSDLKSEYPEAALVGTCSTFIAGSATWMFKTLQGITPVDFDDQNAMVTLINEKHFMTYVTKFGINMTTGGFVTSGEYVDVMLGVQWIQNDMEERIQKLLVSQAKVNFDNGGIALIASEVEATLRQATANEVIRKNDSGVGLYSINVPDVASIDPNDIAKRELTGITWEAYLSGAIHHVVISGIVQY